MHFVSVSTMSWLGYFATTFHVGASMSMPKQEGCDNRNPMTSPNCWISRPGPLRPPPQPVSARKPKTTLKNESEVLCVWPDWDLGQAYVSATDTSTTTLWEFILRTGSRDLRALKTGSPYHCLDSNKPDMRRTEICFGVKASIPLSTFALQRYHAINHLQAHQSTT